MTVVRLLLSAQRGEGRLVRLHGVTGARHVYVDDELRQLARMTPRDAYVLFNNIPRVKDAQRFTALLGDTP